MMSSLPPIRSLAMAAVSSGRSIGKPGIGTVSSSPKRSTCGGRPGENTRSLMPGPPPVMVVMSAGVSTARGSQKSEEPLAQIRGGVGRHMSRFPIGRRGRRATGAHVKKQASVISLRPRRLRARRRRWVKRQR